MDTSPLAAGLAHLPKVSVLGLEVPEAGGFRSRLLGLSFLDRREAGAGLLIPRCRSVHTFGMRFRLDVVFLDADGLIVAVRGDVGPRRILVARRAAAVLELPVDLVPRIRFSGAGGEPGL